MNKKMEEMLRLMVSNYFPCDDCPMRKKCDEMYGNTSPEGDGCFELLAAYVDDTPLLEKPMREYTVDVCFTGHKEYIVQARDEHEAELKAFEMASYRDVEHWDQDYCVE